MTIIKTTVAAVFVALVAGPTALAATPNPAYIVEANIPGPDGGWDYASVDPVRNRLYVARSDGIMVVDLATGNVTARLASAQRAHQVMMIRDGREIVETDGKTGLLRFIDADTGAVINEVATGKKPDAAIIDPATGLIVVANADDGTFTLVDPKTRTAVGSVTVGGSLEYLAADGRGTVWVNSEDTNEVIAVDIRHHKVTARIALTGCDAPTGLALVAGGKRLISACANGVATIVDPTARRLVGTLAIGKGPDAVKFDEKRGLAFIPCGGDGVLEIISAARVDDIRVIGRVKTAVSARTAALDPRTGKLYLPSATILPPEPGAKRGAPKPGSFSIIVIAPKPSAS